LRRRNVK